MLIDLHIRRSTFPVSFFCITRLCHTECLTEGGLEAVDERTENWPVKDNLCAAMDQIKYQYKAMPLLVYIDDRFVKLSKCARHVEGCNCQGSI